MRDVAGDALLKRLVAQLGSPLTNEGVKAVQSSLDQLCDLIRANGSFRSEYKSAGGIPILSTLLNCGERRLNHVKASSDSHTCEGAFDTPKLWYFDEIRGENKADRLLRFFHLSCLLRLLSN